MRAPRLRTTDALHRSIRRACELEHPATTCHCREKRTWGGRVVDDTFAGTDQ